MNATDLLAAGFLAYPNLPQAFTHCLPCGQYNWFVWYQARSNGALVAACKVCGTLQPSEAQAAARLPEFRDAAKGAAA